MAYLVAADVLPLAGYPDDHSKASDALAYAESIIDGFTGLALDAAITGEVKHINLTAKTFMIPLARDVTTVSAISPNYNASYTLNIISDLSHNRTLTWLDSSSKRQPFDEGFYMLTQNRSYTVNERINKAASLLAAYYLGLSDPDRSRYATFSQGDISGSMRLDDTPVPEATALLRWFVPRSRGALV